LEVLIDWRRRIVPVAAGYIVRWDEPRGFLNSALERALGGAGTVDPDPAAIRERDRGWAVGGDLVGHVLAGQTGAVSVDGEG
jgi:hypothetical protein